ncbi:MAG: histone deacetylase family protein [Terriglobales bacterium]
MLPFKLVYSDAYYLPIGTHIFPAEKYRLVARCLREKGVATAEDFVVPQPADDRDVLLAHGDFYVHKLRTGTLSAREELQMEIPYSDELVEAFLLNAGGSILAARQSLRDGIGINLGGGFHHAFPDHGEGFCMINDVAVAIRALQRDKLIVRAMVVDCDVHQGNGTAVIFGRHPQSEEEQSAPAPVVTRDQFAWMREAAVPPAHVFTISLHQENNYPVWKPPSSIDVNFADGADDQPYLDWLARALDSAFAKFQPEVIAYVAGADPYREDQLGGLNLSLDGLRRRDEYVFRLARERHIPIFATLAGGYARQLEDTVTIHCNTVTAAASIYARQGT